MFMAKGNIFTGTLRGKVGDVIFSRQGGEQRSRAYIPVVKNPRTQSQMRQRVQLSNLVSFYRNVIRLFPSAFSNKPQSQSDYNQFVAKNLAVVPVFLTKPQANAGACVCAPYQITHGTLSPVLVTGSGVNARTNLKVGEGFVIDETTTIAALSAAIIENNEDWVEGMQLSYVSAQQSTNPTTGYPMVQGYLYSLTLNTSDERLARDFIPEFGLAVNGSYIGHGASAGNGGFAWVKSSIDASGKISVSSQRIILASEDLYRQYSSSAQRNAATASYNAQSDVFLNPRSNDASGVSDADIADGIARIASVSIGGSVLTAGATGSKTFAAGSTVRIQGSQLSDKEVKIAFLTQQQMPADPSAEAVLIGSVVNDAQQTNTLITGSLLNAQTNIYHVVLYADGELVYSCSWTAANGGGSGDDSIG